MANSSLNTHLGFGINDLREVFSAVCDPDDWKAPISAWVPGEQVKAAVAAIDFMTATQATVELDQARMRYLVSSVGYRAGPAGDH